jgi:hypothetical protein
MSDAGIGDGGGALAATMTGTLTTPSVANGAGVLSLTAGGAATVGPVSNAAVADAEHGRCDDQVASLASTRPDDDLDAGRHERDQGRWRAAAAGSLKAIAGDLTLGALTVSGGTSAISATGKGTLETVTNAGDMTLTIGAAASSRDMGNAGGRLALSTGGALTMTNLSNAWAAPS